VSDGELVTPDFWDGDLLAKVDAYGEGLFGHEAYPAPSSLYRLTREGAPRLYFAKNPVRTYPSVTSILHATCPTSPHLIDWIAQHGKRRAEYLRDERAAYGTCMHELFSKYLREGEFDLSHMDSWVDTYAKVNALVYDTGYWPANLKQDLVGFAGYCVRYNVRPVGIEVPLADDVLGYAGCLDLVCVMDTAKKKNILAYNDWKSNRKYFTDEQEIQVNAYKALWNANYPHAPITDVYLYGPKDWDEGSRERCRVKNCTASRLANAFPGLMAQFNLRDPERKTLLELDGLLTRGVDPDNLVKYSKVEDVIERTIQHEDIPQATHHEAPDEE
jgi:hypothetical protein